MNIKPVRDFVAVVKEEAQKQTSSGIYMPDVVESNVLTGRVVAVGSGHIANDGNIIPLEIHTGDRVVFNRSSAVEVKVDNTTVLMVREENVICKLKNLD
jgi:chaperonin GroES